MNFNIIFRPEAELDLDDAYQWYEKQLSGLGDDLIRCIEKCLTSIKENPEKFQIVHKNIRRALVDRFPYGVLFFTQSDKIIVLSVFHAKRNPKTWITRF